METDVVQALQLAASESNEHRKLGQQRLIELGKTPGFLVALLTIYGSDGYEFTIRWLSVIHLKNLVDVSWRPRANSALKPEEKEMVRMLLLQQLQRPEDMRLLRQLSVVVAKVAKQDFPRAWPNMLEQLCGMIKFAGENGQTEVLEAVLEATYRVAKTLGTVRIGQARTRFSEWSVSDDGAQLMMYVFKHLVSNNSGFLPAYIALKLVGLLLYNGHDRAHHFDTTRSTFSELLPIMQQMLGAAGSGDELVQKMVIRIGKIYVRMMDSHPIVICNMLGAGDIIAFYVDFLVNAPASAHSSGVAPVGGLHFYEKMAIGAMQFIRNTSRITPKRHESILPLNLRPRNDEDRADLQAAYSHVRSALTAERLDALTKALLSNFFQVTQEDVEMWESDPAEFFFEETSASYDYNVSLSAEMLFGHLLKAFPDAVAPFARNFIVSSLESRDVLLVEAALKALEFGAATFQDSVNLEQILPQLLQNDSPIVRRRVCLLVAAWIPVQTGADSLQRVAYDLSVDSLRNGDLVVQLAALKLVGACADDLNFSPELFEATAAQPVFAKIWDLLQPQHSVAVKLHVLGVLGLLIECMGYRLAPEFIDQIIKALPPLWEQEANEGKTHSVQTSVLQTLASLVSTTGPRSTQIWPVALPFLDVSSDPNQPLFSYLGEDALKLWKALLVNAPEEGPLGQVFERLIDLLETCTEYLSLLLSILESYWVLVPRLADQGAPLRVANVLTLYLTEFPDNEALQDVLAIIHNIEQFVAASSSDATLSAIRDAGLIPALGSKLIMSDDQSMASRIVGSKAAIALGRLALKAPADVTQALNPAQVEFLVSRCNNIAEPRDRKLVCLGSTALLHQSPPLFGAMAGRYIDMWSYSLDEIPDSAPVASPPQLYEGETDDTLTMEQRRLYQSRIRDPAAITSLEPIISSTVAYLRSAGYGELLAATGF